MYAEVVLSKISKDIDRIYHYSIPPHLKKKVQVGSRVVVPFGRRVDVGYVVGFVEKPEVKTVKNILKVTSEIPLFTEKQVQLARWISYYYCSFFATALKIMLPPGEKILNPKFLNSNESGRFNYKSKIKLTSEQQHALKEILSAVDAGKHERFLLYGITGSGKTEIYLQVVDHLLETGKEAIVLVPEIALTPQLIERFRERFGSLIAVFHSGMPLRQRAEEWWRIALGSAKISLGTRLALFAPVKNLGIIVIDEEYENTYKSEKSPRYHAREVAIKLGELNNAVVVMGSATPSVETYFKAGLGVYKKLILSKRIDDRPLPPVEVVDMQKEKDCLLSLKLRKELKETLDKKEQAILFINRRGFFTFVACRECGAPVECPKCSLSLVYDLKNQKLCCYRCGSRLEPSIVCPRCQSTGLKYFGIGTQRIEKEVAEIFPTARILRWDRDAVDRQKSHEIFFSTFAQGKADVLIGTQMVTKGLDVAKVTLVGVVSADFALNLPDFRSAEHTFQLLTQVAGRAGRHHLPGKVIIQTYNPEHYAIQAVAKHDYEGFYRQEIRWRKELNYPPFSSLISIVISSAEERKVMSVAKDLATFLKKRVAQQVLGPAPAAIPKMRGKWRYRILIKGNDLDGMRQAVLETLERVVVPSEVKVSVDVDPLEML